MLNTVPPPAGRAAPEMSILDVEDRLNTALNAMLLAHDFTENVLNHQSPEMGDEANTASYAIGHAREMVREAHQTLHHYMAQEFAKRRAA